MIVVSLVVASLGLPRVLKGLELPPEPSRQAEEDQARAAAAEAAIRAIENAQHALSQGGVDVDLSTEIAARLMELYRQRIDSRTQGPEETAVHRRTEWIERQLRLAGVRAERDEIFRLGRDQRLEEDVTRRMVRELDLLEARYAG